MSISLALQNSLSGLNAAQAGLAVVSQNVANANTPGYSRQIAGLEAKVIAGQASGVRISGIERVVDQFLVSELQSQRSVLGAATATEQFLTEI
jgi:flagellar hook-associated protein 1 FlgK